MCFQGEKGDSCMQSMSGFARSPSGPCTAGVEGVIRYNRRAAHVQICSRGQWEKFQISPVQQFTNNPQRKSCLDILFHGESHGDGMYWINPLGGDSNKNAFRVYCDMTTAGGGWNLVAKITDDYSWVCPSRGGSICLKSSSNPKHGSLFHNIHQRDSIDLSITHDKDAGVHLNNSLIRMLFKNGRQSIRFTFVTKEDGWNPSEDAYAIFHPGRSNTVFVDGTWAAYNLSNMDYTWNIIKHTRRNKKFEGKLICWGNDVMTSYRYYDHGLHFGSPASRHKPCLLDNNENEIMLKSHYAILNGQQARWDMAQFGFLSAKYLQAENKRIAIWVR